MIFRECEKCDNEDHLTVFEQFDLEKDQYVTHCLSHLIDVKNFSERKRTAT